MEPTVKFGMLKNLQRKFCNEYTTRSRDGFVVAMGLFLLLSCPARAEYPPVVDLAQESPDVLIMGATPLAYTAGTMCAGDINGDGFLDLVVAACNATPLAGQRQGEVAIIWGPVLEESSPVDLAATDGNTSRIFGQAGDDPLFCGVTCGDFNNDGCDDIIWGEPSTPSSQWSGKAYVILGQSQFPDTLDLAAAPPNVFTVFGHLWLGWLGNGLCACDFNGDGYDEIILSAPGTDYAEVYLLHGGDSFETTYYTGQDEPGMTRIVDDEWRRGTGLSMACEDIDGDGYEDLLLGAPGIDLNSTYDGRATLLFGRSTLPDTIILSDSTWRTVTVLPEYDHGQLGRAVAIGDVDGDDLSDLLIGAYQADPCGCENCGEVYVLYDAASLPETVRVDSEGEAITRLIGDGSHWFGVRVLANDFDGDNRDDIVISESTNHRRARVNIFRGRNAPPDTIYQSADTMFSRIIEESQGTDIGFALLAGDFNDDQVDDLVVGAQHASPMGRYKAGAAYLFYGVLSSTAVRQPAIPPELVLAPNYPNPFSEITSIEYVLPAGSDVTIAVYNVRGQLVYSSSQSRRPAGVNVFQWTGVDRTGRRAPSGIYFYRVEIPGQKTLTRKAVLLR